MSRRCICVYPATPRPWLTRLTHPRCPYHGSGRHWKVTP